ncbi:MAG: ATP-binding cassette domain-containing protein [Egibacteraceae bacterium]
MTVPLLELRGVGKRFGAVHALTGVDFECNAGEVVALVGDNGAGKSTLAKIIAGILPADRGEIRFEGRPVTINDPKSAALRIATVYQDLALCDNLDVVANLYLGREVTSSGWLEETEMERAAIALLGGLSVTIPDVRMPVASLSGGQRQSVAIARATMGSPKLVVLDEPTAALGVTQTRQVLDLIRRLREQDLGIVVISHNLAEVFAVSDRIVVLRLGRRIGTFHTSQATTEEVVSAISSAQSVEAEQPSQQGSSIGPCGSARQP